MPPGGAGRRLTRRATSHMLPAREHRATGLTMGIYDRDYIREDRRRPATIRTRAAYGWAGLGMWSVTTWIIVLCCAVHFIDRVALPRSTWQPVRISRYLATGAPSTWDEITNPNEQIILHSVQPDTPFPRTLVDEEKEPIGEEIFQWMPPLKHWLHFSTSEGFLKVQFWRLAGFQFLHANFTHLLFNMIGLFFFGSLVENYLGRKRYLAFYLLAGICGALLYVLLNLAGLTLSMFGIEGRIPGLLVNDPRVPLVGASAGVFGVLMAGAFIAPRATVLLFFFIPMQLRTLAYALVVLALITLVTSGHNAGGEAGHLGGAIAGFYFIRHPHHLHGFFDLLGRIDPTSHHYRKSRTARPATGRSTRETAELDRILIKIKERGMGSLSARERKILQQESRR